jgi:hypothetical protein
VLKLDDRGWPYFSVEAGAPVFSFVIQLKKKSLIWVIFKACKKNIKPGGNGDHVVTSLTKVLSQSKSVTYYTNSYKKNLHAIKVVRVASLHKLEICRLDM